MANWQVSQESTTRSNELSIWNGSLRWLAVDAGCWLSWAGTGPTCCLGFVHGGRFPREQEVETARPFKDCALTGTSLHNILWSKQSSYKSRVKELDQDSRQQGQGPTAEEYVRMRALRWTLWEAWADTMVYLNICIWSSQVLKLWEIKPAGLLKWYVLG